MRLQPVCDCEQIIREVHQVSTDFARAVNSSNPPAQSGQVSIYLFIYLFIHLSTHLYIYPFIHISTYLSVSRCIQTQIHIFLYIAEHSSVDIDPLYVITWELPPCKIKALPILFQITLTFFEKQQVSIISFMNLHKEEKKPWERWTFHFAISDAEKGKALEAPPPLFPSVAFSFNKSLTIVLSFW